MSRVQHWKREQFDAILSSPTRLFLARMVVLLLLGGAMAEAWFARTTLVERLDRTGTRMRRLVALEDSVELLRVSASSGRFDSAKAEAFRGVFENWDSLASWLETQRRLALKEGWALEWKLTESVTDQPHPFLHQQEVELHVTMSISDFHRAQAFLRKTTESDNRRVSLVKLRGGGDSEGITDLTWTLLVWVRHG